VTVTPGISTALLRSRCISSARGSSLLSKYFGIGPDPHRGAALAIAGRGLAHLERLDDVAAIAECDPRDLPAAPCGHLEPLGERIGDADADAVQAAREAVGTGRALLELAAGVQPRVDDLDDADALFRMQAERHAAPSSTTLTEPSACSVTSIDLPWPTSASSAALSTTSCTMCSGVSVRVYMPGRCLTGSRPFSTRIDASP
jgi:hypothetical protein